MSPTLRSAVGSDVGRRRPMNQDSAATTPRLLAVADGMGGHAHGEVASAVAIARPARPRRPAEQRRSRRRSTCSAELGSVDRRRGGPADHARPAGPGPARHRHHSGGLPGRAGCGSASRTSATPAPTCCATASCTGSPGITRWCRRWSTRAGCRRRRRPCTRGGRGWCARLQEDTTAEPDLFLLEGRIGDRYLICSDGVTAVLDDPRHPRGAGRRGPAGGGRPRLIELANEGGGPDNITCVVADLVDGAAAPGARAPVVVGSAAT